MTEVDFSIYLKKGINMRYLLVLLLAGCASEPVAFSGPNARQAYSMKCSGGGRSMSGCYEMAGKLCPSGYNIVGQNTATVAAPVPMQSGTGVVAAPRHELAIECK